MTVSGVTVFGSEFEDNVATPVCQQKGEAVQPLFHLAFRDIIERDVEPDRFVRTKDSPSFNLYQIPAFKLFLRLWVCLHIIFLSFLVRGRTGQFHLSGHFFPPFMVLIINIARVLRQVVVHQQCAILFRPAVCNPFPTC